MNCETAGRRNAIAAVYCDDAKEAIPEWEANLKVTVKPPNEEYNQKNLS